MSFLFPAFLLGGLAAAAPILLHFFARDRAPRLPFSDVRFLERAFVRRDRRRRLRELLLLALRVAALLLLAVAFARPFLDAADPARRITVVAVDRSLSLSAPGQMALARRRALEVVAATPSDESIAVVAFDATAEVVAGPAAGRPPVHAAIGRIAPTAGATSYPAGLAAAVEALDGRSGRIVLVTDLQAAGWPEGARAAVPEYVEVEVAGVPPVERNLAVTAAGVEGGGLAAVILNTGSEPVETETVLLLAGREVVRRPVTLQPGATEMHWNVRAAGAVVSAADRGPEAEAREEALRNAQVAAVRVTDRDGYRWDDTRYVLLGPASPTVVHVVANSGTLDAEAFYLAQALGVAPGSRPFEVRPVTPAALTAPDASGRLAGDVVVIVGTDGLSRPGRARIAAFVEAGGGLLLAPGPGVDPRLVRDLFGESVELAVEAPMETSSDAAARRLAVVDPRHPVFRPFGDVVATLGQVRFTGTIPVTLAERGDAGAGIGSGGSASTSRSDSNVDRSGTDGPARVLARFDHGDPALIEYGRGDGRAFVFASDLNMGWNDFPRRPGFVPFLQETVRYLAGPGELPRDVLPADAPPGVPRIPGAATDPASGRRVAVNVDPRESEPGPLTPDEFLARLGNAPAGETGATLVPDGVTREAEQSLWWYVVLAVAVVLVGEAWLGRSMA